MGIASQNKNKQKTKGVSPPPPPQEKLTQYNQKQWRGGWDGEKLSLGEKVRAQTIKSSSCCLWGGVGRGSLKIKRVGSTLILCHHKSRDLRLAACWPFSIVYTCWRLLTDLVSPHMRKSIDNQKRQIKVIHNTEI